jgi:hypothetical protein
MAKSRYWGPPVERIAIYPTTVRMRNACGLRSKCCLGSETQVADEISNDISKMGKCVTIARVDEQLQLSSLGIGVLGLLSSMLLMSQGTSWVSSADGPPRAYFICRRLKCNSKSATEITIPADMTRAGMISRMKDKALIVIVWPCYSCSRASKACIP